MEKGRRYEGVPDQAEFQMMEFERYRVLISSKGGTLEDDTSTKSLPTADLLIDINPAKQGELLWRISMPIMCLILMLLAIPMGFVNPRAGRSGNLIIALLLYITYSNVISLFKAAVMQNRFSFGWAWWPVHGLALLMMIGLFAWRLNVNSRVHPLAIWSVFKRYLYRQNKN
jgi:lipopolysaccharide export system permease protein